MSWLDTRTAVSVDGTTPELDRGKVDFEAGEGVTLELEDDPATKTTRIRIHADQARTKAPVRVVTVEPLPAYTRDGNVITADAVGGPVTVNGVELEVDDDVLVRSEGASHVDHGIWRVTDPGSGGTALTMARRADADESSDFTPGMRVPVLEGDQYADSIFTLATDADVVLNSTALAFVPDQTRQLSSLIDDLRAQIPSLTPGQVVHLKGHTTENDGGEGSFICYEGGSYTDDDGTVLVEAGFGETDTKCVKRVFSGPLDIRWFGASPSASAASNTTAINRALLAAYGGASRAVYIPRGNFPTNGTLNVYSTATNPVEVFGEGYDSCITATIAGNNAMAMVAQGSDFSRCTLRDFRVTGQFARAVSLSASTGSHVRVKRLDLSGATFDNGDAGTTIATLAVGGLDDVWIEECYLHGNGKDIAARVTVTADAGTNVFSATAHGFLDGEFVSFENSGGALPGGLTAGTEYVIRDKTADTFKVAATVGGAAVNLSSNGTGTNSVFYRLGKGYEILKLSGTTDSRVHVNRNRIVGSKTYLGICMFDSADSEACDNEIDQGNTAGDDDPYFTLGYGFLFYDTLGTGLARRNTVSGNKIRNCAGMGIYLEESWDADVSGANQLYDVCKQIDDPSLPLGGIVANGCDATIANNTVRGTGAACIAFTYPGTTVQGNKLSGASTDAAISLKGDADNSSIVGNVCADCTHGVMANNTNPAGLTVVGNTFTDVAAPISEQGTGSFDASTFAKNKATGAQVGALMPNGSDNTLDDNTFDACDSFGMDIGGDRNTITRNKVWDSVADGGIRVTGADCRVLDNEATGNAGTDIDTSTATRVERLRNRLTGEVTEDVGADNVACTVHASGTAANGSQFDAITWTPPDDSTYIVTATVKLKKTGAGAEALILAASYDTTSGTTTLQGPAAGAQATFHQPNTQAWAAELGLATDDVALKLTLEASCAWEVKLQIDRLDA